ncbi:MAG TPA: hypothetical protein VGS23_04120 [Thermoplasmata archaeon]|nr:hypothetical protein [Thermoplasmata archaeon]
MPRRLPRSAVRRAVLAISAVVAAEIVGTVGFHLIEGAGWVDAFFFESMLATGQGPPFPLATDAGKIFASIMGFVSVGSVLSAVIFAVGPLVARWWREGLEAAEGEVHRIGEETRRGVARIERDFAGESDPHGGPPGPPGEPGVEPSSPAKVARSPRSEDSHGP